MAKVGGSKVESLNSAMDGISYLVEIV